MKQKREKWISLDCLRKMSITHPLLLSFIKEKAITYAQIANIIVFLD